MRGNIFEYLQDKFEKDDQRVIRAIIRCSFELFLFRHILVLRRAHDPNPVKIVSIKRIGKTNDTYCTVNYIHWHHQRISTNALNFYLIAIVTTKLCSPFSVSAAKKSQELAV